jgi:REP element-mobilizing transposase RayT
MARSIRIQMAGGFYHVMARGNRREKIFADDDDRRFFLSTLSEACGMTGWRVHAWVLMGNHYHLFIETPEANLVEGMKWLQNAYTRRFNVRHRKWGRLFGDRYKAVIVEGSRSDYYRTLMDYIHLNPVRARIVEPRRGESVMDYPWSSVAGGYALPPGRRAKWLAAGHGLGVFECGDTAAGRRRFVGRLDRRAMEEEAKRCGVPALGAEFDARCSHLRKGWYWGTQAFAERLLRGLGKKVAGFKGRTYRSAPEKRSHDQAEAQRCLAKGLTAAGLDRADLKRLPGSDARKVALASLLWGMTTVSQTWIADALEMGSAANVSQQIRRWKNAGKPPKLPRELQSFIRSVTI